MGFGLVKNKQRTAWSHNLQDLDATGDETDSVIGNEVLS